MRQMFKKFLFPVIGFASLIWFLVRVIPKPSRAAYPCMRATAPLASTFIIYMIGMLSSVLFFKKARIFLYQSRYVLFSISLLLSIGLSVFTLFQSSPSAYAETHSRLEGPNLPMGEGKGINPGRVVWVHDPDATNENCLNRRNDYWSDEDNTNQTVVNAMLSRGLQMLTGETTDAAAWNAIFRYYNSTHGKGDVGYTAGEKIVIKINLNAGTSGDSYQRWSLENIDTSPQIVYAMLDQLINTVGVTQADIGFGDPGRNVDDLYWDKIHPVFPNVKYWGNGNGRTPITRSSKKEIMASDGGWEDYLPTCYIEAAYMINLPVLKKHHRAGISLTSKNHFGTFVPFSNGSAANWHYSLPASEGAADVNNGDYGLYRCFVDIMGHKHLGGKTVLFLVDGIWGSTNWAHPPIKWRMTPFNNDWPSSIFLSQDPVAIQSVGFDFLYKEFDENHPTEGDYDPSDNRGPFPHYAGVDDFLHQAADSDNWPASFTYDPEGDGSPLPKSLGTHEHWNNAEDKQYTRNLGGDTGIELLVSDISTGIKNEEDFPDVVNEFTLYQNYPNPFNAGTTIWYKLAETSQVSLVVYNTLGQKVQKIFEGYQPTGSYVQRWDGLMQNGKPAPSGVYMYKITALNGAKNFQQMKKMVMVK
jgi:hypothetical protein